MKQVFYHFKKEVNRTFIYRTNDSIKQIKEDIKGNGGVIDAILYERNAKITLYTNKFWASDILNNAQPF